MIKNSQSLTTTIIKKQEALDAPPLNFSYKGIEELEELRYVVPRGGKRKEIPKIDIPDVNQPSLQKQKAEDDIKLEETGQQNKEEEAQENEVGESSAQQEAQKQEISKKEKEIKKSVSQLVPTNQLAKSLIVEQSIPLNGTGTITQKGGTSQLQQPKKVQVDLVCVSLNLSQNKIRSLKDFYPIMDSIMFKVQNLQWIDFSHNYLEKLDYDFKELPNLKTLYLHENYLIDINELSVFSQHPLKSLTIHGNPIEQIPNFRLYIAGQLPTLQRLDSVLISKKERDNANYLLNQFKNPPKIIKNPQKPPEKIITKKNAQSSDL